MAWIYFRELVESELPLNHGCELSPTVSENPMHRAYYCHGCNQVKLTELPSGTTLQLSEEICSHGSTSSSEDSLVRISVLQDVEKAWQESEADCLTRSLGCVARLSQDSSFWKMSQLFVLGEITGAVV